MGRFHAVYNGTANTAIRCICLILATPQPSAAWNLQEIKAIKKNHKNSHWIGCYVDFIVPVGVLTDRNDGQ